MNYKIEISFDGTTFIDYTSYVLKDSVEYKYSLHSEGNLEPNSNNASFRITKESVLLTHLANFDSDIYCRISLNNEQLIEGIISPTYDIVTAYKVEAIKLTVEDYTISRLKKRFTQSVNFSGYYVCNPSATSTSIVHRLLALAGIQGDNFPTITNTVSSFVVLEEDKATYFDKLKEILFEYGYVFYFNKTGKLAFYDLASTPVLYTSITNLLKNKVGDTESNIVRNLNTTLRRGSYDKINLTWYESVYKTGLTLFEETEGAKDSYPCYIEVPAGKYYPGQTSSDTVYSTYENKDYEIQSVVSASLDWQGTGLTLSQALTNYGKKALFSLRNPNAYSCYLTKLKITGSAYVKGNKGITTNLINSDVQNVLDYDCKYINNKTNASNLSTILKNFYTYNNLCFEVSSKDYFELGSYIKIDDEIKQNFVGYGRIRQITYNKTGYYTYSIESIAQYSSTDTSTIIANIKATQGVITSPVLASGTLPVSTNNLTATSGTLTNTSLQGSVAGLQAGSNTLYLGIGTYNNPNTPFYVDTGGKFSLGSKLSFDGTNLIINGNGTFTGALSAATGTFAGSLSAATGTFAGSLSAATGTFAGALSGGTISIGSGNSVFKADTEGIYLGNATFASAPFRVSPAGAATLTNADISGKITTNNITATGGKVGCLSCSSTTLYLGSGTYNNANTPVYFDDTGKFSLGNKLRFDGTTLLIDGSIAATYGEIGGFTVGEKTITATNLVLTSGIAGEANITVGTGANSAGLGSPSSSSDIAIWAGSTYANRSSANVRITAGGVATLVGATISGTITTNNITANGGTIASWIVDTDSLRSASTGARIQLTKSANRVSIYDSSNVEQVVLGYMEGKRKNAKEWDTTKNYSIGELTSYSNEVYKCKVACQSVLPTNASYWDVSTEVWGSSDKGLWVNPSSTCQVDGVLESKNGSLIATDGNIKVKQGSTEILRLGSINGNNGLAFIGSSNTVQLVGIPFQNTTSDVAVGQVLAYKGSTLKAYASLGIRTTDNHSTYNAFIGSTTGKLSIEDTATFTSASTTTFNSSITVGTTLSVGSQIQLTGGNVYINSSSTKLPIPVLTPTDTTGVYGIITTDTTDNVILKKQLIPDWIWTTLVNQNLRTNDAVTFATASANAFYENGNRLLSVTGTAASASKLSTARRISLSGDATGYVDFDGSADVSLPVQVATDSHYHTAATISGATSGNTASTIVMRGTSGEFGMGALTATSGTVNGTLQVNGNIGCTGTVDGVDIGSLSSFITGDGLAFPAPTEYALSSSSVAINGSRTIKLTGNVTADIYVNMSAPASGIYQYVIVNEAYSSTGKKITLSCGAGTKVVYLPTTNTPSILIVYTMTDRVLIPASRYS